MTVPNRLAIQIFSLLTLMFIVGSFSEAKASKNSAELFRAHAYSGKFEEGARQLSVVARRDQNDIEARFGLGALQFFTAVKNLQSSLYEYGAGNRITTTRRRGILSSIVPVLRFPVPYNPEAKIASYPVVRQILTRFVDDLQRAEKTLGSIGNHPVRLKVEPLKIAVDVNLDGKISENETLLGAYLAMTARRGQRRNAADQLVSTFIVFDTADISWLQGYANALMAVSEFFLAFDFEQTYDNTFHVFFGLNATQFGREMVKMQGDPAKLAALQKERKLLYDKFKKTAAIRSMMNAKKRLLWEKVRKIEQKAKGEKQRIAGQLEAVSYTQAQKNRLSAIGIQLKGKRQLEQELQKQPEKLAALKAVTEPLRRERDEIFNNPIDPLERARLIREQSRLTKELAAKTLQLRKKIATIKLAPEQLAKHRELSTQLREKRRAISKMVGVSGGQSFDQIFDLVTFIHTANWKVISPKRLASVRTRLLKVMQLNRVTWQQVMAETDDNYEWLPNANQKSPFSQINVNQQTIDAWLAIIKTAEDVLEGRKLLPHPRLPWGINLKRFFENSRRFDLVMFLTGPDAIPYLEKGDGDNVVSNRAWRALTRPLDRRFGTFAVWFN